MKTTEQVLIDALKKIREVGYDSKITRLKETTLEIIRIAEDAILEAENAATIERPPCITSWIWYHFSFADRSHWQNCIVAAYNAGASDIIDSARKMYVSQGGEMLGRGPRKRNVPSSRESAAELFKRGQAIRGDLMKESR